MQAENNPLVVRPQKAANILGISLSSFWLKAKSDPDFPTLIKLSPRTTVVRLSDLEKYITAKAK